jgi:DNA damage-inducible protein 1
MPYVVVYVNSHRIKALVGTGAQGTLISSACAEACGIMPLLDTRFAGLAHGTSSTARILGRVHHVPIKIGTLYLNWALSVIESSSDLVLGLVVDLDLHSDLVLGLDLLRHCKARIDLVNDALII